MLGVIKKLMTSSSPDSIHSSLETREPQACLAEGVSNKDNLKDIEEEISQDIKDGVIMQTQQSKLDTKAFKGERLSLRKGQTYNESYRKRTLEQSNKLGNESVAEEEEEDPFMDKENKSKSAGQDFMRIPEMFTKKQKVDPMGNEAIKYRLSVAKKLLNESTRQVEVEQETSEKGSTDALSVQDDQNTTDKIRSDETIDEVVKEEEEEEEEEDEEAQEQQDKEQYQQKEQEKHQREAAKRHRDKDYDGVAESVKEEIDQIRRSFRNLDKKYKLLDKIGEGTFSTVYKARVLTPEIQNISVWNSPPIKKSNNAISSSLSSLATSKKPKKKFKYVALKRIYVTSSPQRIYNELNLLYTLTGCSKVAPLIDAIRHQDQVIAVLPYYRHSDFRYFYRDLSLDGIKIYMFELLSALSFVHSHHIIHRDVKPTNFLYDPFKRRGVLVDFGLAERELILDSSNTSNCLCYRNHHQNKTHECYELQHVASESHLKGYPKDDARPGRRANRAGTRGFRAPEVLFKCANQTSKIDVWSAGVVLLTLLSRRFTFFNSPDDVDALVELTTLFGYDSMKKCANLHGLGIDTSIHKLRANSGYPMSQIIQWAVYLDASNDTFADDSPALETLEAIDENGRVRTDKEIGRQFKNAISLLERCFDMNPYKRITADEALAMPFFNDLNNDLDEDVNLD